MTPDEAIAQLHQGTTLAPMTVLEHLRMKQLADFLREHVALEVTDEPTDQPDLKVVDDGSR